MRKLIETEVEHISQQYNVERIEQIVTAKNLCSCKHPIDVAFKVHHGSLRLGISLSYKCIVREMK